MGYPIKITHLYYLLEGVFLVLFDRQVLLRHDFSNLNLNY
nr:MAG TPA: hypothetical protein [Myoviridae sp. ctfuG5]